MNLKPSPLTFFALLITAFVADRGAARVAGQEASKVRFKVALQHQAGGKFEDVLDVEVVPPEKAEEKIFKIPDSNAYVRVRRVGRICVIAMHRPDSFPGEGELYGQVYCQFQFTNGNSGTVVGHERNKDIRIRFTYSVE